MNSKSKSAHGEGSEVGALHASVWDAIADTSDQAANLRERADLMRQIASVVIDHGWTQAQAASLCAVTQPRFNDLMRGRVSRFSLDALVNIATALGRTVKSEQPGKPTPAHPEPEVDRIVSGVVRRGLKPVPNKTSISLRIDPDVLEWFKAQGAGYQARMNLVLRAFHDASVGTER